MAPQCSRTADSEMQRSYMRPCAVTSMCAAMPEKCNRRRPEIREKREKMCVQDATATIARRYRGERGDAIIIKLVKGLTARARGSESTFTAVITPQL